MTRHESVLVGVDGSEPSMYALHWAIAFAQQWQWPIHLVCTYALPAFTAASLDGGYAALDDGAIQEGAQAVLAEAQAVVSAAGVPVETFLRTGDAAGVLVEMSVDHGVAIVGTRGRGGFTERFLGSVSSALPAHAHCPTVVVPWREEAARHRAATRGATTIRRIVVGVDGSATSVIALRHALRQAQRWDAELVAVGGVPLGSGSSVLAWLPAHIDREQVLAGVEEKVNDLVDHHLQDFPGMTVRRLVLDGTGAELMTEFSTASDLMVMGSRGRGGFKGLLLGSTSQAVLHHSACPVMVITKRGDEQAAA